jgi:hypothetical protein
MLGLASTMSSSSSNSSALESARALQPNLDTAISSAIVIAKLELSVIPEMLELDAAQLEMEFGRTEPDAPPSAGGSTSMSLN